jgi:hypothetical protein
VHGGVARRELAEREKRLAQAYEDEANPESNVNKSKLTMAEKLAGIRSAADITEAQKRSDIHLSEEDKLAQLLGRGKYAAPKAVAGGKSGGGSASISACSKVFPEGRSSHEQATQPQQGLG